MCFKSLLLQLRASGLIFKPWAEFCLCRWSFGGSARASGAPVGPLIQIEGRPQQGLREGERPGPENSVTWWETWSAGEANNLLLCTDIKSYLETSRLEVMVLNICMRGRTALHFWFTFTVSGAAWLKLITFSALSSSSCSHDIISPACFSLTLKWDEWDV